MTSHWLFKFMSVLSASIAVAGVMAAPMAMAEDPNYSPPHIDNAYPNYQPPYPASAQVNGEQGAVVLHVQINGSGHIRKAQIETSSGFDDLDNAALEGVMGWHFVPAIHDGEPETDWTSVKIVFTQPTAVPATQTH